MSDTLKDVLIEASKGSPPVSVAAMSLAGIPLSDWVLLLTALYTLIQIYFTLKKNWRRKDYCERERDESKD